MLAVVKPDDTQERNVNGCLHRTTCSLADTWASLKAVVRSKRELGCVDVLKVKFVMQKKA